jgi:hypothetical protein
MRILRTPAVLVEEPYKGADVGPADFAVWGHGGHGLQPMGSCCAQFACTSRSKTTVALAEEMDFARGAIAQQPPAERAVSVHDP